MDNLTWTTDKPAVNGFYWARCLWRFAVNKEDEEVIMIVRVDIDEKWVELPGTEITDTIDSFTHWKGPIFTEPPVL